jgi:hypothetical protein
MRHTVVTPSTPISDDVVARRRQSDPPCRAPHIGGVVIDNLRRLARGEPLRHRMARRVEAPSGTIRAQFDCILLVSYRT